MLMLVLPVMEYRLVCSVTAARRQSCQNQWETALECAKSKKLAMAVLKVHSIAVPWRRGLKQRTT
eukprot:1321589-Amphidinium_carterae.1